MQKILTVVFSFFILYTISAIDVGHTAQIPIPPPKLNWYKGNTHAHTTNSDGDSTPDEVTRWYREQGYNFLVLSDHNFLTKVESLNALHGADEKKFEAARNLRVIKYD